MGAELAVQHPSHLREGPELGGFALYRERKGAAFGNCPHWTNPSLSPTDPPMHVAFPQRRTWLLQEPHMKEA